MLYHYVCSKCGKKRDVEFSMGYAPCSIECDCGERMTQDFLGKLKSIQTHLSEDYRSQSEFHSVDYGDDSVVEYACND